MNKWLERLEQLMAETNGKVVEFGPVDFLEKPVGTVPEHLRPLYLATAHLSEEANRVMQEHDKSGCEDPEKCDSYNRRTLRLIEEFEAAKKLFFVSLRHELDVDGDIGIRADWTVVQTMSVEGLGVIAIASVLADFARV